MMNEKLWTSKRKRSIAKRMISLGGSNDKIKDYLRKQCGTAISSESLAAIRAELGISGPNRKKKTNGKKESKNEPTVYVPPLPPEGPYNQLQKAGQRLINEMKKQGIKEATISTDGTITITQVQVTTFQVIND